MCIMSQKRKTNGKKSQTQDFEANLIFFLREFYQSGVELQGFFACLFGEGL